MRIFNSSLARDAGNKPPAGNRPGLLKRLWREEQGSLYALGAFMAMPLIGLIGVGADTAKVYMAKAKFAQALDAAALAAAKTGDNKTYKAVMEKYFKLNFPDGYMGSKVVGPKITSDAKGEVVKVTASLKVPTDFMHLFGINNLEIGHQTEVTRKTVKLDIVLSFDMSGSMGSYVRGKRKIDSAREAGKTLVDALYGDNKTNDLLKIGLVPWNGNVNVKIDGKRWDGTATKKFLSSSFKNPVTGATQSHVWTTKVSPVPFINEPNNSWKGCVYARYTKDGVDANDGDALYGSVKHNTGDWVAWELRNDDQIGSYQTVCKDVRVRKRVCTTNRRGRTRCRNRWVWERQCNQTFIPASSYTPCLSHGITPMTQDRSKILAAINALKSPTGNTNLPQGLAWAWRVLMPSAPFTEGSKDDQKERLIRAVVLLSDGSNCANTGDGYKAVWGGCNNTANGEMDKRLKLLAKNMKKAGVHIYVIQFGTNSSSLAKLLKEVASSGAAPHYHYAPDGDALKKAFKEVATSLSDLRISK